MNTAGVLIFFTRSATVSYTHLDVYKRQEHKEHSLYDQRTAIGRIADQKSKFAKEMPVYANVPVEPVSASELIRRQQDILCLLYTS